MSKPSAFRAEVEVNGAVESAARLNLMGRMVMNTFPLMEEIKELLFAQQRERVQSMPWAPLKESTVARKVEQAEDPTIFHDEWRPIAGNPTRVGNQLWLALTLDGATGQIKRATRTTATFGVDSAGNHRLFYARFVQNVKGTQRRILAISDADALTITEKVAHYIYDGYYSGSWRA